MTSSPEEGEPAVRGDGDGRILSGAQPGLRRGRHSQPQRRGRGHNGTELVGSRPRPGASSRIRSASNSDRVTPGSVQGEVLSCKGVAEEFRSGSGGNVRIEGRNQFEAGSMEMPPNFSKNQI